MDEVGNQFEMNYVEQGLSPQQRPADTEVKQHWARIVLGWVTAWELLVLLTKTKAELRCGSM